AYGLGTECLRRAQEMGGPHHIPRPTGSEAKTPLHCYPYPIVYQMFYGMRDVLGPLALTRRTPGPPFQYSPLRSPARRLVEARPGRDPESPRPAAPELQAARRRRIDFSATSCATDAPGRPGKTRCF